MGRAVAALFIKYVLAQFIKCPGSSLLLAVRERESKGGNKEMEIFIQIKCLA